MSASAFTNGVGAAIAALVAEIAALYLADDLPWIVGYSGGKDSTATLQLAWMALRTLTLEQRRKPVHVISTDTLVENPIVARWADASLVAMREAAAREGLPIQAHRLSPDLEDSFWVNLIGKGYPAPRRLFRWCTDRMKIRPSNKFIRSVISERGEAILLLGTRKAESATRAANMKALEAERVRDRLSPNASLPGSLVYSPVEDWSNDDVWLFLLQFANPWGWSNKSLMSLYKGASEDGECPVVVDTSTPSCGASRFGCWVCTLVEQDKSMKAMILNDDANDWMRPLLTFRDALDFRLHEDGDRPIRDFRRMNGRVQLMMAGGESRVIPGPYTQKARANWLRMLLETEREVQARAPADMRDITLISVAELDEIRRTWVIDKHEIEDHAVAIYTDVTGKPWPGVDLEPPVREMDSECLATLREIASDDHEYAMMRDLLAVESEHRRMARRAGLYGALEDVLRRYQFRGEQEAVTALGGVKKPQLGMFDAAESDAPPVAAVDYKARAVDLLTDLVQRAPTTNVGTMAATVAAEIADT